MIDTMNICFNNDQLKGIDLLRYLLDVCEISNLTTHQEGNREWITGNLGNYKVSASYNYLNLKGSISKWHLGNNIQELTYSLLKEAIAMLSDTLCLPMNKAKINRLDISGNLFVLQDPEIYFALLEYDPRFKKFQQPNSLYFQSASVKKLFYDKVKESKAKHQIIPDAMKLKNLFRYELDFLSNKVLQKKLNISEVSPLTILETNNYNKLIEYWKEGYSAIKKKRDMIKLDQIRNFSDYKDLMFAKGLLSEYGSMEAAIQDIEQIQHQGVFKFNTQAKRIKDGIKNICQKPAITLENPLIIELDSLIESKYKENLI